MLMLTIAWTLACAGAALFAVSMLRRTDLRLHVVRRGAMIVTAIAAISAFAIGTPSAWLLTSTATALLLTVILGLATTLIAGARQRALTPDAETTGITANQLWRDVSHAVANAPSLNEMLMSAASAIRQATESQSAVVYKLARNGREVIPVGSAHRLFTTATPGPEHGDLMTLARRSIADGRVAEYTYGSHGHPDDVIWGMIPLRTETTVYGAILLENPETAFSESSVNGTFTAVGRLLGRATEDWVIGAVGQSATQMLDTMPSLLADLSTVTSFERGLPAIANAIRNHVDAGFISLAWLDRAHFHEDRVSMVIGEQKMVEQRRRWPVWEGTTHKILHRTTPLITPDLAWMADDDVTGADSIEQRLGLRARIVVPIRAEDNRLVGSLTLAHKETAFYGEDECRPLEFIATLIGTWLARLEAQRTAEEFVEAAKVSTQLENDPATWPTEEELLTKVLGAVGSTGLRLYRITDDGHGVRLAASAGHWRDNGNAKDDSLWPVPLSELPWHRWALSDGTALRINQGDPEALMGDDEMHTAMTSGMKTGWIVPVRDGDRTYGFLDAMEARDPDRQTIREPQRMILNAAASAIARRWSAGAVPLAPTATSTGAEQLRALNGTVVNPITGIIGSVELIRHKQTGLTGETVKYLNLIEHSATRIHEALLGTLDRIPDAFPEQTGNRSETIARRLFGALTLPATDDTPTVAATRRRTVMGSLEPVDMTGAPVNLKDGANA